MGLIEDFKSKHVVESHQIIALSAAATLIALIHQVGFDVAAFSDF